MSLNPILALDHVIEEYRDYLRSEFRARDRDLRRALEAELDRPLFLAQEPFYQAHRPLRAGTPWASLPIDPALARCLVARSGTETAYLHQSESISHLLSPGASPLVVTTGTGSGKTECFLLPVIQNAIDDARGFDRTGLTAILIYPMNALANDQEKRIGEYLEAAGATDLVDVRKYDRGTDQAERQHMRNHPPRILLTNYMMLEYLLTRPADRDALFANHRCRFLVLDEVHTYRGVLGSNIALLLRRLRAHLTRARHDWATDLEPGRGSRRYPELITVGTSATIKSDADPNVSIEERAHRRDAEIQGFFGRLTGEAPSRVRIVGEVLEAIQIPTEAGFGPAVTEAVAVNVGDGHSVESALARSAGIEARGDLGATARRCRLLWLLNRWLVARPMSLEQVVSTVAAEVPERQSTDRVAVRREVESVLLAGSALPEGMPGALRLRAHRLIRGGWKFVRCVDPGCGRIYPMGEPTCACGRLTAPLFLCRSCGADYLRLDGDPEIGQMRPYGEQALGEEWMLYDVGRQEADVAVEDEAEDGDVEGRRPPRRSRARVEQVRGQPVHQGAFDPRTLTFSRTAADFPMQVRLVRGRTRCLCCGGTAGTRNVITHVALGTSAAIKVLGEGLVEALAEANADRAGHDGKERLLIFSDSRQDAAHQARFIIFASRYDRMRRKLYRLLGGATGLGLQRAVELLGDDGVRARDNPHAPQDPNARLSEDERQRLRAWEEAPLLDDLSVNAFFRGTLFNLGVLAVDYDGLETEVRDHGEGLCHRWGIQPEQLVHLCRCFLDELRVRGMLSRELLRYHPGAPSRPDYLDCADWERKAARPRGLPGNAAGQPEAFLDSDAVPAGISVSNVWRQPRAGGRAPVFQRILESFLGRWGAPMIDAEDGLALLRFLHARRFLITSEVFGIQERFRVIQLNAEFVRLWVPGGETRARCQICSWPMAGAPIGFPCPRCHGSAVRWSDDDVEDHRTVRRLRQVHFRPLVADEHTAQVTNERRVDLEERFKASAAEAALNVLACSPTLEMGIDVGGLDAVVLRNVPPRPDNYAQRGGRAGRRTRVGLVVGYARRTPHDQ